MKLVSKSILYFLASAVIFMIPNSYASGVKLPKAGSLGVEVPIFPVTQLNYLTLAGSVISFKYHLSDELILSPGFSNNSQEKTTKSTTTYNDSDSTSRFVIGLYYIIPYSNTLFFEIGPSYTTYSTDEKDQITSTETETTKTSGTIISIQFRPVVMINDNFGVNANLGYYTQSNEDKLTSTSGSSSQTTKRNSYIYSTFGLVWYL